MKSRMLNRGKKATVLISQQTLEQAIREGEIVAERLLETNPNDPNLNAIEEAVSRLQGVLNMSPADMQANGASTLEDFLDDAVMGSYAKEIKKDVDFIASLRQPQGAPMAEKKLTEAAGSGADAWVTDRDAEGKAKTPEQVEVPRLAAKKKEAEPAPVAPAAPAPTKANPIDYIPTETLLKVIEDMPKEEDFAQNKGKQNALIELTHILQSRPVMAPPPAKGEEAAPAAPAAAPIAASKKKAAEEGKRHDDVPVAPTPNVFEGSSGEKAQDSKTAESKEAVAPEGWEGTVKEMKKDTDIDNPWALAWHMKDEGYTPHKASWLLKKRGGAYLAAKMARAKRAAGSGSDNWSNDGVKGNILEGSNLPEVAEAHGKTEKAPADKPSTTPMEKLAAASKDAESLGEKLKALYLDAKPLTAENNTRPVRDFVESIYRAYAACDEAVKILSKQEQQEKAEKEAQEIKETNKGSAGKRSSLFGGLKIAAEE